MHANRRTDVPEDPSHTATRQRLMDRRQAVLSRVTRTERELHWLGANVESDAAEEAAEDTAADLLLRLDDLGRRDVAAIDAALDRLARDEYGICTSCGTAIPAARLEAMPETPQCISCARTTKT